MINQSNVTIIIPHYFLNEETTFALNQCLTSLLETCECKIVVASNAGQLPLFFPDLALQHQDRVSWIHLWDQGQNRAVNAAVAATNTPWILVTNNDMVYAPGWWEKLVGTNDDVYIEYIRDHLSQSSSVAPFQCISPMLIEPQSGAPTFKVHFCGGAGGDFDKQKFLDYAKNHFDAQRFALRTGFNLPFLIKRELWETVGGYDINYDPWGSNGDSDLEYKIRLAGVQPYQNPNCVVYHFSQTSGTFEPQNHPYWQKNWDYFISKWGFPRTDDGIWEANFHMPTKEEGRIFQPEWEGKYAVQVQNSR